MFDGVSLAGLTEVMAGAATADTRELAPGELVEVAEGIEQLQRYLDAAWVNVLAQIDADDVTDERFGLRTARWLEHHAVVPPAAANRRVRIARRVHEWLPHTLRSLGAGRIGEPHANVMAHHVGNERIRDRFCALEAEIVAYAEDVSFEAWKRKVDDVAARLDVDGPEPDEFDHSLNRLSASRSGNKLFVKGVFVGAWALGLEEAISRGADDQYQRFQRDAKATNGEISVPYRTCLNALALVELVGHGHQARLGGTAVAPAADITLVCEVDELTRATSVFGSTVSDRIVSYLACNAEFSLLLVDRLGVPLDLGRAARYANRDQRRALLYRHRGTCAFPGCNVPLRGCHIHHIIEWDPVGRTDLVNLVPLCPFHHGVTHRQGWAMTANGDGTLTWTTPLGQQLHSRPPPGLLIA